MEQLFGSIAAYAALTLEALVILFVCIGAAETIVDLARCVVRRSLPTGTRRAVWMRFARWLLLALEFALGADIIRTAIVPSWNDVGQLAVIATVRTVLGFFLERDIATIGEPRETKGSSAAG